MKRFKMVVRRIVYCLVAPVVILPALVEWFADDALSFKEAYKKGIESFDY